MNNEEIEQVAVDNNIDAEAFAVYCNNHHITEDYEDEVRNFEDSYRGEWNSFLDFAIAYFNDIEECPEHLRNYIDYEAYAREMRHDFWETDGYVFFSI